MITSKELRYVNEKMDKIPMPGVDYSMQILDAIDECHEIFKDKYKDKEYSMIFSDSEELDFEILDKNLCHMLGINYSIVKESMFDDFRKKALKTITTDFSSYDLLNMILENKEDIAIYDNNPENKIKFMNYYKSSIKCSIFNKLSNFTEFNFAAINYIGNDSTINYSDQKYLFVPSNEVVTPYFMMLIKQRDDSDKYVTMSLMAVEDPNYYFENQEVILPTQILVSDNNDLKKIIATPQEKLQLIAMYTNIVNKYQIPNRLNIFGDYESILNEKQKVKSL